MKRIIRVAIAFIICLVPACSFLWAMGSSDVSELQPVNGLENWDRRLDVSELKPGKYNIMVQAVDCAGNIGTG